MWSTPLAQKGFLRICAQTRRDLSLVYNNPQWRIQGRHPGGPGHPLLLDQSEAWRAEKNFFWDRDSPSPRTSTNGHFSTTDAFFLPPRWPLRRGSTTGVPSPSLPADVLWSSFVTHSFLPNGRPWGRNECVTNKAQRTSAGRLPKLTLRVCNVNLLSHEAVSVALQATVQTYLLWIPWFFGVNSSM